MKKLMLTVLTGTMLLGSPLFAGFQDGEGDDEVSLGTALKIFKKPAETVFSFNWETEGFGHYGIDESRKFSVLSKCGEYDESKLATYMLTRFEELDNVKIKANWTPLWNTTLFTNTPAWTLEISADSLNESTVVSSPQLSVTFQEILQSEPKATEESFPIHRYFIPKENWPTHWTRQ